MSIAKITYGNYTIDTHQNGDVFLIWNNRQSKMPIDLGNIIHEYVQFHTNQLHHILSLFNGDDMDAIINDPLWEQIIEEIHLDKQISHPMTQEEHIVHTYNSIFNTNFTLDVI